MSNNSPLESADKYIKELEQQKSHYRKIILLGGSEGAVVVNLITSKEDFIDASIALNGGGRYFIDDVIYNIKHTARVGIINSSVEDFK